MTKEDQVAAHYASASLVEAIKRGIQQLGKTTQTATIADLAPVDEFHIGRVHEHEWCGQTVITGLEFACLTN